ncbi:MAG: hypothetical protein GXO39_09700 [Thermotogae bacterium]|nr:hypothetical protein [Thermotogota bacterium]
MEREKGSGLLIVRRKIFNDPLLIAYILNGEPIFAESFTFKGRWWEGLMGENEYTRSLETGNPFLFAAQHYGEKYRAHIKEYARKVIETALKEAKEYGWKLESEFHPLPSEEIEHNFGISLQINVTSGVAGRIREMGFDIFYIDGEEDFLGFFKTISTIADPVRKVVESLRDTGGSFAFLLPLYILLRLDFGDVKVCTVTKDVGRAIRSLRATLTPTEVPLMALIQIETDRCCRYTFWRSKYGETLLVDGKQLRELSFTETVRILETYLDTYERKIRRAVELVPSTLPNRMKEMLIQEMVFQNMSPDEFEEAFASRFSMRLEDENA